MYRGVGYVKIFMYRKGTKDIYIHEGGVCQDVNVQEGGEFRSSSFHVQTTQGGVVKMVNELMADLLIVFSMSD